MTYSIDAYFLNKSQEVVAIQKNIKPNRLSRLYANAASVLEFKAGERICRIGDKLDIARETSKKKSLGSTGQATVEFAMTFIIFAAMLMGLAEMSRVCYSWVSLQFAVSEGGRQAMLGTKTASKTRAQIVADTIVQKAQIMGLPVTPGTVKFYDLAGTDLAGNPGAAGDFVEVRASARLTPLPLSEAIIGWTGDSYKRLFNITARTVVKNEPFS